MSIRQYAVVDIHAQAISLPKLSYYGLGSDTSRDAHAAFAMQQNIAGARALVPLGSSGLNLSLLGEVNGRFVDLRPAPADAGPSIYDRYTEATAPGLSVQPGFVQFGEGVRIKPTLGNGRARLNYLAQLQQFVAPSDSRYSFRRWTVDLKHELPFYRSSPIPAERDTNGPNECQVAPGSDQCPGVSRNRTGAFAFRALASRSQVGSGSVVPFYVQQTIGGSDINGQRLLASYDDYRFRAPHVLVFQESLEHTLGDWPVGVFLAAEQGKAARASFDLDRFLSSYSAGITLRAGGLPVVVLAYGFGGREGGHFIATVSTSLLGGSSRPSLH